MVKIKDIKDFLDMSHSTKCLYFYLSESTDEYDFVKNPETIAKAIGADEHELKELIEKRFLVVLEDGVIVIKNPKLRNVLLGENLKLSPPKNTVKINKDTLQKVDMQRAVAEWNTLQDFGIAPVVRIDPSSQRMRNLKSKLLKYTFKEYLQAIDNIRKSPFLQGDNNTGWRITLKWFVEKDNFDKVLSGQYNPHGKENGNGKIAEAAEPLIPYDEWIKKGGSGIRLE